jgi:hypothetical protein
MYNKKILTSNGLSWTNCKDTNCNTYLDTYQVQSIPYSNIPKTRLQYYMKNSLKYNGVAMKYLDSIGFKKNYPRLSKNTPNLGYTIYYWLVNPTKNTLLYDINTSIEQMKKNNDIDKICKKYIQGDNNNLCNI